MATYTRRITTVEARQHFGVNMPVSSSLKGDQIALNGDFLVVDPFAVARIRAQEKAEGLTFNSLGNKGTIYVVSKGQFLADYNATDETPGLKPDTGFNVPDLLDPNAGSEPPAPAAAPAAPVVSVPVVETVPSASTASNVKPLTSSGSVGAASGGIFSALAAGVPSAPAVGQALSSPANVAEANTEAPPAA